MTETTIPALTESDIRRWTGEASFSRGQRYFEQGHILHPRRQGGTLKARCLGSQAQPYHVAVTLGPAGIVSGECSCPVGAGGHCKHAAALLLTWLHEPDSLTVMEDLETALQRRSKDELIALIRRMIDRDPDLDLLLELPTVGGSTGKPVDPAVLRRQVDSIFRQAGYEWGAAREVALDLLNLVELGNEYAYQNDWPNAALVYETVARETLDHYHLVQDEEGDLHEVVNGCVAGLGACLAATTDSDHRAVLLRALFDVYRWDVDFGGIDMGYAAPGLILEHATPAERQQVAAWVRAALPTGDSWGDNYHRQIYGGFLLQLAEGELDDEAFLRLCRETGRRLDLVDRLLALGRLDEARREARQAGDYDLLRLADVFLAHEHPGPAEALIRERAQTSRDNRLLEWLKRQAEARGDLAEALRLADELLWRGPTLAGYQEVRRRAQALAQWPDRRAAILTRLTQEGKHSLLTEIYLDEGLVDEALVALEQIRSTAAGGWAWMSAASLRIQVAAAAEASRPRDAIRLYREQAERIIAARDRGNYATAAAYLARVRDLYHRLGEPDAWQRLITDLREQNRRLRALKEELERAGL